MKKIKNLALLLVVLALAFVVIGCSNDTPDVPDTPMQGEGTSASPYLVSTPAHLNELRTILKGDNMPIVYVRQEANITLSGNWEPLGKAVRERQDGFTPSRKIKDATLVDYNGNGKKIINLSISSSSSTENTMLGFFAGLGGGSKVYDLSFENVAIDSQGDASSVGVVAGGITGAETEISNVTVLSGSVEAFEGVGGIVGRIFTSGKVTNSENNAKISGRNYNIGGIVGIAYADDTALTGKVVVITGNKNTGAISVAANSTSPTGYVGGIVGYTNVSKDRTTLTGNTNEGVITGIGKTKIGQISGSDDTYNTENTLLGRTRTTELQVNVDAFVQAFLVWKYEAIYGESDANNITELETELKDSATYKAIIAAINNRETEPSKDIPGIIEATVDTSETQYKDKLNVLNTRTNKDWNWGMPTNGEVFSYSFSDFKLHVDGTKVNFTAKVTITVAKETTNLFQGSYEVTQELTASDLGYFATLPANPNRDMLSKLSYKDAATIKNLGSSIGDGAEVKFTVNIINDVEVAQTGLSDISVGGIPANASDTGILQAFWTMNAIDQKNAESGFFPE